MIRSWPACAVFATVACCGCASPPVNYYSLTPAAVSSTKAPSAVCCTVDLKTVRIPLEVDRAELVARRTDQQLDVLGNDVWLAPLRDEIKSALLVQIKRGLADAATTDDIPGTRRFVVVVDVQRFESVLGGHALAQAQWRVKAADTPKSAAPTACEATVSIDVHDGVSALVSGHQRAVAAIADRIAADILDLRRTGVSRCLG